MEPKRVFSVEELSQELGIGINQAYALVRSDNFPSIRINRRYLVPVRELDAWLSEQAKKGGADERI